MPRVKIYIMEDCMKICICTIIKNEHQYLDEWIQYHLNLGIDHIFIFEDIDSDTHEEITNKYSRVSLNSIKTVLNETDLQKAISLKQVKKYNAQHMYFRSSLNYIKSNYDYDWCFVIDIDEFITLTESTNLKDIIEKYNNYDAFILQWQCYGANELINKPDYSKKGVLETFSSKMSGKLPDIIESFVKTCYNLHTYSSNFFFNQHHPTDLCNWVNTNFRKNYTDQCYNDIYIRHYVTKSFEEYVWKRTIRGFMWGGTRKLDVFFDANPVFKNRQRELINAVKEEETLVILPYKQSSAQGTELELTLSFWRVNCTFNYRFIVIGEYDKELETKYPWVEFIECKSREKVAGQYNAHLDILNKFKIAMEKYKDRYTGFIAMCDDIYAIKPFTVFDILQTHYHSSSFTGDSKAPTSYWRHDKWKTRQLFDKEGLPHVNHTTHFPYWYDIEKLEFIIDKFNLENESYVLEDLYFNYYEHEKPILDSDIRLGVWNHDICRRDFDKAVLDPSIIFMCNSVEGWSNELEMKLKNLLNKQQIKTNVYE